MEEPVKKQPPLPSHCSTPLTLNNQRKALLSPSPGQHINPNNLCRKEYKLMQRLALLREPNIFELSKLQEFLLNNFNPGRQGPELTEYRQGHAIASELFDLQVKTTLNNLGISNIEIPVELLINNPQLQAAFLRKVFFAEAVVMSSSDATKLGTWWTKNGSIVMYQQPGLTILCGRNLFVIQTKELSALTSRDHLTILSDLAAQRFSVLLQSVLALATKNEDCPSPSELYEFLLTGDKMLSEGGNEAYDLVYSLEASCVSRLIGNYEGGSWETSKFRITIRDEQRTLAQKLGLLDLYHRREKLLSDIFYRNPQALSQLYGLYRIWGHPTLEPLRGVIALKTKGLTPRRSLSHKVEEVNNQFKEEFIKRYINHHKEWPLLDVTELSPNNVIRVHYERKLQYPSNVPGYDPGYLSLVKFQKIFPVDPKFDLIEFIDDKALSLGINDLLMEITQNKSIGSSLSRSLLLAFLKSDISDPEEFLNKIDRDGFPDEEICVGVHEKEREGKLKARLFGLLTLVKRSYVVLTEKLIADHLFPYFPEITMTDDERALEKKRLNFTSPSGTTFFVSLDFSKWNTNMRHQDTHPFFEALDQMFGFNNCFTRTHEMFHGSLLYLIDGSYLPPVVDGQLQEGLGSWKYHLGGIEGLRQKGWTVWTVSLIKYVAKMFDFKLSIMGQGDNQMLSLTFPDSYDDTVMINQVNEFIKQLSNMLSLIGPPLKTEETWVSKIFYLYGKYPVLNGAPLTMSWKRSCRLFWCCNEDYPTLESSLSSLAANLFSAVASDNRNQALYYVYLFELVGCFQNNLRRPYLQRASFPQLLQRNNKLNIQSEHRKRRNVIVKTPLNASLNIQSTEVYWGLLLCPRTLGGYPIVLYPSILVKGFPDQLSYDIATLQAYEKNSKGSLKVLLQRILNPYLSTDLNYNLLVMNPEALNLEASPSPSEARRGVMIEFLTTTDKVTQPYVKEFLNVVDSKPNQALIEFLAAPHQIHPKIMNTVIQATAEYRAQQVIGKLQKTPTMARLYQKEGEKDLYLILEKSELNHFKSVMRFIFSEVARPQLWDRTRSAVDNAMRLRNVGWRKEIIGVDCAPPHEIFGLEKVVISEGCPDTFELDKGFITIRVCTNKAVCEDSTRIGPVFPYRGSITKTKNDSVATKIKTSSPSLLKRAIALAELKNWVFFDGSKLEQITRGLLQCVTDTPYDLLTPELDQVSGTAQHRLRVDRIDSGGTSPNLPTQATKLQLDTSSLTYLVKGGKNMNFMFQPALVLALTTLGEALLEGQFSVEHGTIFHLHMINSQSIKPVDEDPPDYSDIPLNLTFKSYPTSPYLYFPFSKIQPYIHRTLKFTPVPRSELDNSTMNERFHSLLAYDSCHVLDPWTWTSNQDPKQITNGITINWALNCDLILYIKLLSRILLITFVNMGREVNPEKVFHNVITIIKNSPSASWENLANISFHPRFPSDIYRGLSIPGQQTQEITTPHTVGGIMKSSVLNHLIHLSLNPKSLIWDHMEIWSPPAVAPVIHPLRVLKLLEILSYKDTVSQLRISQLKQKIEDDLQGQKTSPPSRQITLPQENKTITIGITSESLDYLCKQLPEQNIIDIPDTIRSTSFQLCELPSASSILHNMVPKLENGTTQYHIQMIPRSEKPLRRSYNDYVNRPAPLPTSGSYKLISIMGHLNLNKGYNALCLADGTGGFTRVLAQDDRCNNVWYNTLVKEDTYVPQMSPIPHVPDVADLPSVEADKVKGLELVNSFPSDITALSYATFLRTHITHKIDIITGDAESPLGYEPDYIIKIFFGYFRACLVFEPEIGVFKIHSPHATITNACIHLLSLVFKRVLIIRSHFSLSSNVELYLIGLESQISSTSQVSLKSDSLTINSRLCVSTESLIQDIHQTIRVKKLYDTAGMKKTSYSYTTFLTRHIPLESLREILQSRQTWIKGSFFAPTCESYKYPNILFTWYRSLHRPLVEGNQSVKSRIRLEQFSNIELTNILSGYVFLQLLVTPEEDWNNLIPLWIKNGVLIWAELQQGDWTFIFTAQEIPIPEVLDHTRVYPFQELINNTAIQRICRDVGLAKYLGLSHPICPAGIKLDKLLIHTALRKKKVQFKNPYLNVMIYNPDLKESTLWKLYSVHSNFRRKQTKRILDKVRKIL